MAEREYSAAVKEAINLVERDGNDLDRIIRTAKENLCDGRFFEPRWFYDEITVNDDQTINQNNPDAFKNGEAFPIKITHIIMAIRSINSASPLVVSDERLIQRVGVKLLFHGQEYMAREFTVAPLWHNKRVAAPDSVSLGQSAHRFFEPWLLTARDVMKVQVQLLQATDSGTTRKATVAFAGFGLDSRRPYWKASDINLSSTTIGNLDVSLLRNDGDEPIVMTDMTAHLSAQSNKNDPSGDISLLRVQVNQVGNGTNSEWFKHASSNAPSTLMLAQMLGTHTGRCVVHRLDEDTPIYWEPGEGLNVQVQAIQQSIGAPVLAIALAGTIIIT
jgi:hypothetical protein